MQRYKPESGADDMPFTVPIWASTWLNDAETSYWASTGLKIGVAQVIIPYSAANGVSPGVERYIYSNIAGHAGNHLIPTPKPAPHSP